MGTYTAEQITRIGGREWRKGNRHRVYIGRHVLQRLLEMEVDYYGSGSIRRAELRGQRISNSEAARILASEIYWENGELHIRSASRYQQDILDAIAAAIAATEPQQDDDTDGDTDGQGGDASGATEQEPVEQAAAPQQTATAEMAISRLTALRQAGRSVREIAAMIGCAVSTVYRWLRGVHRPSARYATAILAAIPA